MKPLNIIAGNCVIENSETSFKTANFLKEMSKEFNFDLIYKSSFKKDNRSSEKFFSGIDAKDLVKF